MNSPTPGWHPDPTARHDYRYWDGWEWTDDVADGGVTAYDPLPADDGYPGYETARYGPTSYGSSGNGSSSYRSAGYGSAGYGSAGYGSDRGSDRYGSDRYGSDRYGYDDDPYGYGAEPATRRVPDLSYQPPYYTTDESPIATKKGPSARMLVGVGLVAVAMVAGLVFVLATGGQGDEQADGTEISDRADRPSGGSTNAGDTTSSSDTTASTGTTSTTAPGNPGTTAPGGAGGPGGSAPPPAGGGPGTTAAPPPGGGSGSGDEAAVVGELAELFQNSSAGAMSEEQARCLAQGMVDTVGVEGARALTGGGGGMPPTLSAEQQQQLQQLTMECGMGG
jgi:hypothetical protein